MYLIRSNENEHLKNKSKRKQYLRGILCLHFDYFDRKEVDS